MDVGLVQIFQISVRQKTEEMSNSKTHHSVTVNLDKKKQKLNCW